MMTPFSTQSLTSMKTELMRNAPLPKKEPTERSMSVLLVERDDRLRRLVFWRLYVEGLKVLTARDSAEAKRLSRDVPGPIELLIIGSLPPGADPGELRRAIEAERPELTTLSTSSSSGARVDDESSATGPDHRLDPSAVVEDVKRLLFGER